MQQLKDIFCYFHQYIIPISNSIELLDQSGSYRQIPCELRNVQSHLYRYFHKNKDADGGDSKELKAGLSHMQRAVLDGFKILHRLLVNRCYGKNDQSDHWILKANQQSDLNYNHGPIEKSIENWKVASEYLRSALVVSFENPPSELIKALDSIGVGLISETDLPDPNMEVVQLLIKPFGTLLNLESKLNIWTGVRSEGHNKFHLDLFMELAYAAFGAKTQNYSKLIGAQEAIYVKNLNQFFEDKLLILHKSFAITSHAPHEAYGIYQSFIAQVKPVSIPAKALWQDKNLIQQWLLRLNSITNIPNTYAEIITKFSTDEVFASQNQVLVESMIADLERNKRECADQKARQLSENRQEKNLQLQKEQLKKYEELIKEYRQNDHLLDLNITKEICAAFIDLTGFSNESEQKDSVGKVKKLWELYKKIVGDQRLLDNTWGDAIMCIFYEPKLGVALMLELLHAIHAAGLKLTIGMTYGSAYVVENTIRLRKDFIGDEINLAARIEQWNKTSNSIHICDLTFKALPSELQDKFQRAELSVTKSVLGRAQGESFLAYVHKIDD